MRPLDFTALRKLGASSWVRRVLLAAPVVALTALFIVSEFRGIDFGEHWDEMEWHIEPARKMIDTGVFLPHAYIYPSFSKWLVLLPAVQAGVESALHGGVKDPPAIQRAMHERAAGPEFRLTARRIFAAVTALGIVWLYAAVLALRRRWWEALIAAAGFGLSWQIAYHARWLANDTLVAQFAALVILMLALFERTRRPAWLYWGAVAAGLGTSTKYPAVVLLVPILAVGASRLRLTDVRGQLRRAIALCAVAFAAYLVTTPGTLLEVFVFLNDTNRITKVYGNGHFGYTVSGPSEHLKIVLSYFTFSYFSPWKVVAAAMAAASLWGAIVFRHQRRFAAVLIGFPVLFLAFFGLKYKVCIIRNYQLIGPFLAMLAARGLADAIDRVPNRWVRASLLSVLAATAIVQAGFLVRAGESIRYPDVKRDAREALDYVAHHAGQKFRVSAKVRALAAEQQLALPPNVTEGPADAVVFFGISEGPKPSRWKVNDSFLTVATFGPREVDFNWYSTWGGSDRIVVMTTEKARSTGAPLAGP